MKESKANSEMKRDSKINTTPCASISQNRRQKWTKEQYKEIIWAYHYAIKTGNEGVTSDTYKIWRERNPDIFPGMNAKNLSNQRRFIIKENRLTASEIEEIVSDIESKILNNNVGAEDNSTRYLRADVQMVDTVESNNAEQSGMEELLDMENKITARLNEIKKYEICDRKCLSKTKNIKRTTKKIELANKVLSKLAAEKSLNITEINELMYATAAVIADVKTEQPKIQVRGTGWRERIQKVINECRKDLSYIKEFKQRKSDKKSKVEARMKVLLDKASLSKNQIDELEQNIKMKLQAKAQRLRRYTKRSEQYQQNKTFKNDAKRFYREMTSNQIKVTDPPDKEGIEKFWKGILEKEVSHNSEANWISDEEALYNEINQLEWKELEINELTTVIKFSHNWKAPGIDKVHNFWLKYLTSLHKQLLWAFNKILKEPDNMPGWMTEGTAYLIPKSRETRNPKNYRPIACLPTTYKILTGILCNRIYSHLQNNQILPEEQKGCRKGSRGCKDSLMISQMIMQKTKKGKHDLNVAWIDYKKAFDSVPHTWITHVMRIYKVSDVIRRFMEKSMLQWRLTLILYHEGGYIKTDKISIRRGIYQGDSLSPLIFCMAMIPLSRRLNAAKIGYKQGKEEISHLFYMDDLKIFAKDHESMEKCIKIVEEFSEDIRMEFGIEKCATTEIKKGKVANGKDINIKEGIVIRSLKTEEFYKYLGMDEKSGIKDKDMKEKVKREYFYRVKKILKTQLSSRNKIMAINSLATPVMTYSFGILPWLKSEIDKLDRKTRKVLTINGMHHPRADVDRLYVKRKEGGRGLLELQSLYRQSILSLAVYLQTENSRLIQSVKKWDDVKKKYSLQKEADKIRTKYKLTNLSENGNLVCELKTKIENERISKITSKPLHGRFFKQLQETHINKELTVKWLNDGRMKGETESLLIAAQDQALNTRFHQRHILHQPVASVCRLCFKAEEHISHLVSGCEALAATEYLQRHNRVAGYVHWRILMHLKVPVVEKYYLHEPDKVVKTENQVIMWDHAVTTDRKVVANRPDIIVLDNKRKACLIIDIAIPDDVNVSKKETEKRLKYQDIKIEISRMWQVKARVIAVVVGALGTVSDNFRKEIESIEAGLVAEEIQSIALMGTARILRKVLG